MTPVRRQGLLTFIVAIAACAKAPTARQQVTAESAQGAETTYTSLRPLADSAHPVAPPLPRQPAATGGEDLSSFTISATGPVELVLIDPSGRRTGQAGEGAPDLREIPRSGTDCDYLSDDSDSGGGDTPHVLQLMVAQPDSGRYILEAYGTGAGTFGIDFELTSAAGSTDYIRGVDGTAAKGMVRRYAFSFIKFDPSPASVDTLAGPAPR